MSKEIRMRRYRQNKNLRELFDITPPDPKKFIWPVFLIEGKNLREEIKSMPLQFRYSIDALLLDLRKVYNQGIRTILLFGVAATKEKDETGTAAFSSKGTVQKAIPLIKKEFPDITVITDVCLCAYTSHGHCGTINSYGDVDNDSTVKLLAKTALSHADAGADIVAPSAMMDGQVAAIRKILDENNYQNTLIMSYSTKFASSMYEPFREAENSSPQKRDRKSYQQSYASLNQALRESALDEKEGADILMVKPAQFYLDVIAKIKEKTELPLAVYNVSGEYSMLHAVSHNGWGNLYAMARESLFSFTRAGADIIISYWANQYNKIFEE